MEVLHQMISILGENRVEYIASKQGEALLQAYHQDTGPGKPKNLKTAEDIIKILATSDPTKNKQFLQWIANRYTKNDFSLEDMERVQNDLNDFVRVRNRLPNKDINAYSLDKLYAAMEPLLSQGEQASMKKMQNWEPDAAEKQLLDNKHVRLVYSDDQIRIFTPETFEASCQFGSGTKWCTTWRGNPTHFNSYREKGPLYIIHTPDGKFQFHFEAEQFMNAQDRPAELGALLERYPQIGDVFKELAEKHGVLGLMKNPTEAAMITAVSSHPVKIKELRPGALTPKIVWAAMNNVEKYNLKEVFGHIMHFRADLVTPEIKLLAIKADPLSIKSIPDKLITQEQVVAAMKGDDALSVVEAFKYIHIKRNDLITNPIRVAVLRKDGSLLTTMAKNITQEMVSAALNDDQAAHALVALDYAFKYMPDKVTDNDLLQLVDRSRTAMKYIPEKRQTQEIVDASLANDVNSFVYVRNPTDETIIKALAEGAFLLRDNKYIRNKITTELMKKVAEINPTGLLHEIGGTVDAQEVLPEQVNKKEVILHALSHNGQALKYIEKQTPEMIKMAVSNTRNAWAHADKKIIDKDPVLAKMYLQRNK